MSFTNFCQNMLQLGGPCSLNSIFANQFKCIPRVKLSFLSQKLQPQALI